MAMSIHLGRGSLASVSRSGDRSHPLYSWAVDHNEPDFSGVEDAAGRHADVVARFGKEAGANLDLAAAIRRCDQPASCSAP